MLQVVLTSLGHWFCASNYVYTLLNSIITVRCQYYSYLVFLSFIKTRTTHVYDASCYTVPVRIVHVDRPCGAEMSEIRQSSRTTTVESSIKSEHNLYLACEDSPQRAFFFCAFSCSLLALLASTVH